MKDKQLANLTFPSYPFRLSTKDGLAYIYDSVRKKDVRLTPEEWVRQHATQYLCNGCSFPMSRIKHEHSITLNSLNRRCDIVVFDRQIEPHIIVECKAPVINLTQKTITQIIHYAIELHPPFLIITNGITHYCFEWNEKVYQQMDHFPQY